MKTALTAKPYEWDFDGACAPPENSTKPLDGNFSIGIFQWVPLLHGNGCKRGKIVERVKGARNAPADVYERARYECAWRNEE